MKRLLFLLVMVSCSTLIFAQQPVQSAVTDSTAKAVIVFETQNHNFGTINYGGDGSCVFKFKNEGKAPLVLSNVRASCGCTTPSWTREPIAPEQEGEIKVTYDTKRIGSFSKSITVNSNAEPATVVLRISGEVKQAEQPAEAK